MRTVDIALTDCMTYWSPVVSVLIDLKIVSELFVSFLIQSSNSMSSAETKMELDNPDLSSSDSEHLPDTQPFDSQDPSFEQEKEEEEEIWGQLYPHCGTFPR